MPTPPESDGRLRCDRCGCVLEVTAAELIAFSRGDWPRCCMVAMILDVDDVSVRPTDATALERPAARSRPFSPN
jgi:hypothetical protein